MTIQKEHIVSEEIQCQMMIQKNYRNDDPQQIHDQVHLRVTDDYERRRAADPALSIGQNAMMRKIVIIMMVMMLVMIMLLLD